MKLHKLKDEYRLALRVPLGLALYRPPAESACLIVELVELLRPPLVITVGDFVTTNLRSAGLEPDVAVVDMRTMRVETGGDRSALAAGRCMIECENPPGTLSKAAVTAVGKALSRAAAGSRVLLMVKGEEDLITLPALALAPPRSLLVYGLWLGAAVLVACHPLVSRGARLFMREAFEPPLTLNA